MKRIRECVIDRKSSRADASKPADKKHKISPPGSAEQPCACTVPATQAPEARTAVRAEGPPAQHSANTGQHSAYTGQHSANIVQHWLYPNIYSPFPKYAKGSSSISPGLALPTPCNGRTRAPLGPLMFAEAPDARRSAFTPFLTSPPPSPLHRIPAAATASGFCAIGGGGIGVATTAAPLSGSGRGRGESDCIHYTNNNKRKVRRINSNV
jgi:hypothetical protein